MSGYLMQCCLEYLMVSELEFEYWKLSDLVYCLVFELVFECLKLFGLVYCSVFE